MMSKTSKNPSQNPAQPSATAKGKKSGMRKIATGSALAFVVTSLALAGGAQWTAHEVRSALTGIGVDVASVSVDPLSGSVTLDRIAASQDGVRVSIGSVATAGHFGLSSPAEAAGPVTLTDVEITSKSLTVRIPRIEVAGDNVDEARLKAIFDKASTTPLAKRLSDISVSKATLPELVMVHKHEKAETTTTWKQITVTDLKNGVAGAVSATGATFSAKAAETSSSGTIGQSDMAQVNLALLARMYTEAAANDADRALQLAYGSFSSNDITVKSDDASFAIKNISGKDFKVRLLNKPLLDLTAEIEPVNNPEDLTPEARAAYYSNLAEIIDAFSFGSATITGTTFDLPDESEADEEEEGKQADGGKKDSDQKDSDKAGASKAADPRVRGGIASMAFGSSVVPGGGFTFSGFKVEPTAGDVVAIGEGDFSNFSLKLGDMFRKLADAAKTGKEDDQAFNSLAPAEGDLALKNIDVNVSSPDTPGERVRFTVQRFAGSYKDPVNGVPTAIKTSLDHLVLDLPKPDAAAAEEGEEDSSVAAPLAKLQAMGYQKLDLSTSIDGKWDAATKELRIGDFSFGAVDFGSVKLTGLLGNVSPELFTAGEDRRQELLLAAKLRNLSLNVTDSGFAERFSALQAREQGGGSGAEVRAGWASLAQMLLPSMIGSTDGAKGLSAALGNFIRKSGALDITVTSKKPDGDTIADLVVGAASGNPDTVFQTLDIKATGK